MPVRPAASLLWLAAVAAVAGPAGALAAPRTVLVETFGSVDCGACGNSRTALSDLEEELGSVFVAVEYHSEGPLATSISLDRALYYGSPALPTTAFDGGDLTGAGGDPTDTYRTAIQSAQAVPTSIVFDAVAVFAEAARAGSLNVEIRIDETAPVPSPEQYTLRALIVEDQVPHCCGPGNTGSWDRVVRAAFPERPLLVSNPGEIQFVQHVEPLGTGWEVTNLRAVVWLQRDADRSVLAATLAQDGGGLQPLPIGNLDQSKVNMLPARPNPLRSGRTTILFTLPGPDHARMLILNGTGQVVRVLTDGPRPTGVHDIYWDGTDFTGAPMAAGVYFYRLETSAGVLARKLTLLR
ncbi:MAG: hypothetical protein DHS20C21_04190 [Gemmatimonadota bacterium]|nr:MAG: hypothetical protein DHS20C21_04190 [Gemmatimonadota bacterium]